MNFLSAMARSKPGPHTHQKRNPVILNLESPYARKTKLLTTANAM